jgi:hypothetical protein
MEIMAIRTANTLDSNLKTKSIANFRYDFLAETTISSTIRESTAKVLFATIAEGVLEMILPSTARVSRTENSPTSVRAAATDRHASRITQIGGFGCCWTAHPNSSERYWSRARKMGSGNMETSAWHYYRKWVLHGDMETAKGNSQALKICDCSKRERQTVVATTSNGVRVHFVDKKGKMIFFCKWQRFLWWVRTGRL